MPDYRRLLERARALGYACRSLAGHEASLPAGSERTLVVRHDVDTDPATAGAKFAIERELGVTASYYFRLTTADAGLMREMAGAGFEVGYHFEEIATVAKERRLRTKAEVKAHMPEIRRRFAANLDELRRRTGLPLRTVAAHGDMANRYLGYSNRKLLSPRLRRDLGIDREAYDPEVYETFTSRFIDDAWPLFWQPHDPAVALERGDRAVLIVTHPRHWRRNVRVNLGDDLRRMYEGYRYHGLPWR